MADPAPDLKPGDPLRASVVNWLIGQVRKAMRFTVGPGLAIQQGATGWHITMTRQTSTRLAKAGAGGIAARSGTTLGSGTVTFQRIGGTAITDTAETDTAYHYGQVAVGANAYITVRQVDGQWLVTSEDCPAS